MSTLTRRQRFKNWLALPGGWGITIGVIMFAAIVVLGILVPLLGPDKPNAFVGDPSLPPSFRHPFGLDQLGRDVLSRTFASVWIDIGVSFFGVSIPLVIGTVIGILLGLTKNRIIRSIVGSVIDGINAFPLLVVAVAMLAFFGAGLKSVIIVLSITNWARYARIARTRAVVVSQQNYIEAARTLGYSKFRIVAKHIAPNVSAESVAYALSDFIIVITVISGLSFLGLAARPPAAEWGSMIAEGRAYLANGWWMVIFPGLALCWAAVSLSFIVEGMSRRDRGNA